MHKKVEDNSVVSELKNRDIIISKIVNLVKENYIFPSIADEISEKLLSNLNNMKY